MRYQILKHDFAKEIEDKTEAVAIALDDCYKTLERSNDGYGGYFRENNNRDFLFCCKSCGAELFGEILFGSCIRVDALESVTKSIKEHDLTADMVRVTDEADAVREFMHNAYETGKQAYRKAIESTCPICGAKLCQENGFFVPIDLFSWHEELCGVRGVRGQYALKEIFGYYRRSSDWLSAKDPDYDRDKRFVSLAERRDAVEREKADEAAKAYREACDLPAPAPVGDVSKISKDVDLLKKYIHHLIQMENGIYSLQRQLCDLYARRPGAERAVVLGKCKPLFDMKVGLEERRAAYHGAVENVRAAEQCQPEVFVAYPTEPVAPVLGTPGLFNKKKVLAENEALTAKYQVELEEYRREIARCNEEKELLIAEKRAAAIAEAQAKADKYKGYLDEEESAFAKKSEEAKNCIVPAVLAKDLLDKEIAETEELLRKTVAARNELYAYEIIFGKYRNVVALSSFYEYLMSGRCSSLEGANGAYDIYENEIRANRVIAQLDTVITSLEEIKQNQYMIHAELCSINSSLDRMNSTLDKALTSIQNMEGSMERIAENSDVIAHNTAVTAYYSKINAELTNALGYMVAFK